MAQASISKYCAGQVKIPVVLVRKSPASRLHTFPPQTKNKQGILNWQYTLFYVGGRPVFSLSSPTINTQQFINQGIHIHAERSLRINNAILSAYIFKGTLSLWGFPRNNYLGCPTGGMEKTHQPSTIMAGTVLDDDLGAKQQIKPGYCVLGSWTQV